MTVGFRRIPCISRAISRLWGYEVVNWKLNPWEERWVVLWGTQCWPPLCPLTLWSAGVARPQQHRQVLLLYWGLSFNGVPVASAPPPPPPKHTFWWSRAKLAPLHLLVCCKSLHYQFLNFFFPAQHRRNIRVGFPFLTGSEVQSPSVQHRSGSGSQAAAVQQRVSNRWPRNLNRGSISCGTVKSGCACLGDRAVSYSGGRTWLWAKAGSIWSFSARGGCGLTASLSDRWVLVSRTSRLGWPGVGDILALCFVTRGSFFQNTWCRTVSPFTTCTSLLLGF